MATIQQYATDQFNTQFWVPAKETCNILIDGAQKSFTKGDITDVMWNTAVTFCPLVASLATAKTVNNFFHKTIVPADSSFTTPLSYASTAVSLVIGGSVGLFVAARLNVLSPVQADKALKFIVLTLLSAALAPLALRISPLIGIAILPLVTADVGAIVGCFGHRSLYVVALMGAIAGSSI